ncbi:MAG: TetR/AcrR family transcriptional regulator [Candidatus Udaeobacter sp.]
MAAEDRRQQILRVAVNLFAQRGFRGTTTKEIAHAAGVSEAIIFRHFATKQELYSAILDDCAGTCDAGPFEAIGEAVLSNDDRAVFETLALAILNFHDDNPEFQRLLLHSALESHELAQMFWDQTIMRTYEFLGEYVRRRQGEGAFRHMNPMIIIRSFLGMITHHSINNNLWDKSRQMINISNEEAARQFTEVLLQGILSRPGENTASDSQTA